QPVGVERALAAGGELGERFVARQRDVEQREGVQLVGTDREEHLTVVAQRLEPLAGDLQHPRVREDQRARGGGAGGHGDRAGVAGRGGGGRAVGHQQATPRQLLEQLGGGRRLGGALGRD